MSAESKASRVILLIGLAAGLLVFLIGGGLAHTGHLGPGTAVAFVGLWVLVCTPLAALVAGAFKTNRLEFRRAVFTLLVLAAGLFLGLKK